LRWEGFRKVRRQVCRRIERRRRELMLDGFPTYRAYLEEHPDEWRVLDSLCRVTISRFYRDRGAFAFLEVEVLPSLAEAALEAGRQRLEVWSAGCASGEEPYTLALVWEIGLASRFPGLRLHVLATDADDTMLARARRACYGTSSLKELPDDWRHRAFSPRDGLHCLRDEIKRCVAFSLHDVRVGPPAGGPFDLVLCRNLVFTYFDVELQQALAGQIVETLQPGGALVVGAHEAPPETRDLAAWSSGLGVYRSMRGCQR
jgi:chemotaxis protein methyltransferase CheR